MALIKSIVEDCCSLWSHRIDYLNWRCFKQRLTKINKILGAWWRCWHAAGFPLRRAWCFRVLLPQWLKTFWQNFSFSASRIPKLWVWEEPAAGDDRSVLTIWQPKIVKACFSCLLNELLYFIGLREKQHLLDGTSPNIATRHARWTLEADRVFLHFSINRVSQMNDEHFPLEVDFRDFWPPEVLNSFADRKRADAWEVDADVELRAAVILNRMWVNPVGLESSWN